MVFSASRTDGNWTSFFAKNPCSVAVCGVVGKQRKGSFIYIHTQTHHYKFGTTRTETFSLLFLSFSGSWRKWLRSREGSNVWGNRYSCQMTHGHKRNNTWINSAKLYTACLPLLLLLVKMADFEFEEFRKYFDRLPQYIKAPADIYT